MKIYLAGPDVFKKNAKEQFKTLKAICKEYGHIGISPLNSKTKPADIFELDIKKINECDCIVANLTPFRGACIDDGTAVEIGYGFALGKQIWGYSLFCDRSLIETTRLMGISISGEFPCSEDFNLSHNLMITEAIRLSGGKILKSINDVLKELNKTI